MTRQPLFLPHVKAAALSPLSKMFFMQRLFIIISLLCMAVAAFFLWRRNFDVTFVVAILGVVAWFLSVRTKLKATIQDNEETDSGESQEDEN